MCNSVKIQPHAFEAITQDLDFFFDLLSAIQQHENSSLLLLSIAPMVSMFIVESHNALIKILPEIKLSFNDDHKNLLKTSRHRAKLLDDSNLSLNDLTKHLVSIAEAQRQLFLGNHIGLLGAAKRFIQPDSGVFFYNGHIFSTTHSIIFGFGKDADIKTSAYDIGYAWGSYISHLKKTLGSSSKYEFKSELYGTIQMCDIKYESLYHRKVLSGIPLNYAMGMILLLTNLNQIRYIMQEFSPTGNISVFRLKFLVAFHVNSNLRLIQDNLVKENALSSELKEILSKLLGNKESRWLRKQKQLRNTLAHYLADDSVSQELKDNATREQIVCAICKGLPYKDVDILLDKFISSASELLESSFNLLGVPFWYAKVK